MKFSTAWAEVLRENNALKVAIIVLAIITLALGIGLLKTAMKPATVVERACFSRALSVVSAEHTPQEIEAFLRDALSQRFDTGRSPILGILAPSEFAARTAEQKELASRGLVQRVIVNKTKVDAHTVQVDADRLISVELIRSAFVFPLIVEIGSVARSEGNPYGLTLLSVTHGKSGEKK